MNYEIEYEIYVRHLSIIIESETTSSEHKAEAKAKEYCKLFPEHEVFIRWDRSSDGCRGYLNPGEGHASHGKNWNE